VANRLLSGEALTTDASTAQSRAEVLALVLSSLLSLTARRRSALPPPPLTPPQGLNWVALTPRQPVSVPLSGETLLYLHPELPPAAAAELRWLWATLSACSRTASLAVFYRGARALQAGLAPAGCASPDARLLQGSPIATEAVRSGTANYFANLALFPGRTEFLPYLPAAAQAVVVQPLGGEGVLVCASGTQRGYSALDQRYISLIAQKVDSTLDGCFRPSFAENEEERMTS
jgi:hypothetical protein